MRPGISRCHHARVYHRAFVDECEQRSPRRQIKDRKYIERSASAPGCACSPVVRQCDAERIHTRLRLTVITFEIRQHADQSSCSVHADVIMEDRATDLKHAD
jgi:hypothetical protein